MVRKSVKKGVRSAVIAALLFAVALPAGAVQRKIYDFGVMPLAPPVAMHTLWVPFIERLSRDTGLDFRLKVYDKMSDFEQDISRGGPDFIFANPLQAVVAHEAQGYVPLVRGSRRVSVELFVRRDSPIRTVDDLANRKIALVGNKNFCSILVRHVVSKEQRGKLNFFHEFSGSTDNVIKSVILGKVDAGAVFVPDLEMKPKEIREQLRPLLVTRKIAPHPICAHPRVSRSVQEAVKRAVLAVAATPEGAELLKKIRLPSPVAANYEKDYKSLETIDVKGLSDWGR